MNQKTIAKEIKFSGIGLHTGAIVNVILKPAIENTGVIFKRIDLTDENNEVEGLYKNVTNTQLGTTISNENNIIIQTIEHLMSALWACDIDNVMIEVDNKEIPIMDGSSKIFIEEIQKIGTKKQDVPRKILKVMKEITVEEKGSSITLMPFYCLKIDMLVDFPYGGIGTQKISFEGASSDFYKEISEARTFCHIKEIDFMRANGLALGGSLDNAMVFDDAKILNPGGYRCEMEVAKHKLLDCVGDMFTSGYYMYCYIKSVKGGHKLNNEVLKKLFEDRDNYILE